MRLILMLGLLVLAGSLHAAGKPLFTASVALDFGVDRGQNFGTLFEVRDASGRPIIGAGFPAVYNTRARNDRYQLQFFARGAELPKPTIEALPKPSAICGQYIFDLNGRIYAQGDKAPAYWDADAQQWREDADDPLKVMRVGPGRLVFSGGEATYNDKLILPKPETGSYRNFYYAQGHLFVYQDKRGDDAFTRVWAFPWQPGMATVDLAKARAVECRYVGETPFVWAQLGDEALTVSNNGGVYIFKGQEWRVLRQADNKVSFQVYASLNHYDRLLLAQYPTGNLFTYDGQELKHLPGWPPVMPGVSTGAREAQSLALYGGDLYVGVWPWSELWRYDPHADQWAFMHRMFTQPALTDKFTHPYEENIVAYNQANQTNHVMNDWGQRLTSMAPWRDSLMLATSAKGTFARVPEYTFLTDEVCAEYGRVDRYSLAVVISAPVAWADRPTTLRCLIEANRIAIEQDGKVLGEAALPPGMAATLKPASITWGQGMFGAAGVRLGQTSSSPQLAAPRP